MLDFTIRHCKFTIWHCKLQCVYSVSHCKFTVSLQIKSVLMYNFTLPRTVVLQWRCTLFPLRHCKIPARCYSGFTMAIVKPL